MGRLVFGFMDRADKLRFFLGPATQGDMQEPVVHKHDDYEQASEQELAHFEVETDSYGHHYAVRRDETK
jgi:hypothetical protein